MNSDERFKIEEDENITAVAKHYIAVAHLDI